MLVLEMVCPSRFDGELVTGVLSGEVLFAPREEDVLRVVARAGTSKSDRFRDVLEVEDVCFRGRTILRTTRGEPYPWGG